MEEEIFRTNDGAVLQQLTRIDHNAAVSLNLEGSSLQQWRALVKDFHRTRDSSKEADSSGSDPPSLPAQTL